VPSCLGYCRALHRQPLSPFVPRRNLGISSREVGNARAYVAERLTATGVPVNRLVAYLSDWLEVEIGLAARRRGTNMTYHAKFACCVQPFHAATVSSPGGERSWIGVAVSRSRTSIGPTTLGQSNGLAGWPVDVSVSVCTGRDHAESLPAKPLALIGRDIRRPTGNWRVAPLFVNTRTPRRLCRLLVSPS
jgi:hypothetical protein